MQVQSFITVIQITVLQRKNNKNRIHKGTQIPSPQDSPHHDGKFYKKLQRSQIQRDFQCLSRAKAVTTRRPQSKFGCEPGWNERLLKAGAVQVWLCRAFSPASPNHIPPKVQQLQQNYAPNITSNFINSGVRWRMIKLWIIKGFVCLD